MDGFPHGFFLDFSSRRLQPTCAKAVVRASPVTEGDEMNSGLHVVATSICASAKHKTNSKAALKAVFLFPR
jgi:hypothetical protein